MKKKQEINTTVGDMICAIADAAEEAQIDESELLAFTELVYNDLLDKYYEQLSEEAHQL